MSAALFDLRAISPSRSTVCAYVFNTMACVVMSQQCSCSTCSHVCSNVHMHMRLTRMSHVTYEWVMSHMNASCHICDMTHSYVTWLIHMWHDSFMRLVHICSVIFMHTIWLIHIVQHAYIFMHICSVIFVHIEWALTCMWQCAYALMHICSVIFIHVVWIIIHTYCMRAQYVQGMWQCFICTHAYI